MKEGKERVRSQTPPTAEDRLYKLQHLKFCLKPDIKTGSSLVFNSVPQINSQSMDLLLLSQKPHLRQLLKHQMLRPECTLFPLMKNRAIQFNTARGYSYWYEPPFVVKFLMHMGIFKYFVTFSFCMCSFISTLYRFTYYVSPDVTPALNKKLICFLISIINMKSI